MTTEHDLIRAMFPAWDARTIQRHIEQRERLRELARQQHAQRVREAVRAWKK